MTKKLRNVRSSNSILLMLILLLPVLNSCGSRAIFSRTYDSESLNIQQLDFDYLSIKSKIELKEENKTTEATAVIRIKKDSIIWFNLSGALGVQGMRGIITQDTVYVINRVEKQYSVFSFEGISEEFNFPIDYALVQSMVVGNMPRPEFKKQNVNHKNDQFIIKQNINNIHIENFIDDSNMKLVEIQVTEKETDNALKLLYKDFREINKQAFPFSAFVSLIHNNEFGQLETQMNIEHTRVETPDKPLKFPFSIPDRYERK